MQGAVGGLALLSRLLSLHAFSTSNTLDAHLPTLPAFHYTALGVQPTAQPGHDEHESFVGIRLSFKRNVRVVHSRWMFKDLRKTSTARVSSSSLPPSHKLFVRGDEPGMSLLRWHAKPHSAHMPLPPW